MTMEDVRASEGSNGLVAASLFAGCGGSSIGYKLAGFRVGFACEWVPRIAEIYAANNPGTHLHVGDVRELTGADIVTACGRVPDVLDGSAPCQDWSMMGNRDFGERASLYHEFVRIVGELMPPAFAAENVSGIVMGDAKPRFAGILRDLRDLGYCVAVRTLDGRYLGVPQERRRVVVIGFRDCEEGTNPAVAFPSPGSLCRMRDALPELDALVVQERSRPTRRHIYLHERAWGAELPAPTITTRGPGPLSWHYVRAALSTGEVRKVQVDDLRRLSGFPRGFDTLGRAFSSAAVVFGNCVPPPMARSWASGIAAELSSPRCSACVRS